MKNTETPKRLELVTEEYLPSSTLGQITDCPCCGGEALVTGVNSEGVTIKHQSRGSEEVISGIPSLPEWRLDRYLEQEVSWSWRTDFEAPFSIRIKLFQVNTTWVLTPEIKLHEDGRTETLKIEIDRLFSKRSEGIEQALFWMKNHQSRRNLQNFFIRKNLAAVEKIFEHGGKPELWSEKEVGGGGD